MKKYNILLILFILFTTASCSGLLDEDPRGDVAGSNFFTDEENALSNINDLYNAFGDANVYSRQAMMVMEFDTRPDSDLYARCFRPTYLVGMAG